METERRALDPAVVGAGVAAVLADADHGRYWLAESDGTVAGQLLITYEWSDWRNGRLWWIQSVYVDPEHRRRGVFRALYRHVEALARRDRACCGLRLYVEKSNRQAQRTYRALGMSLTDYAVMELDFGARRD
jgi:ribosomal protein S18 acetylase RimI-like enzyme